MTNRRDRYTFVLAVLLGVGPTAAQVATAQGSAGTPAANGASTDADKNPAAIAALTSMSNYLKTLQSFQVSAVVTRDDVLDDGELIQYDTRVNLLARSPDRLRVETDNARQHRFYFYDGKTFTLYAERVNYFASAPAPATIGQLVDEVNDRFAVELPLADLFYWSGSDSKLGEIVGAIDVGPAVVGGVTCEQYAYRQTGMNWQIWIQQGDFPLPRKLVISTLTDEARPQYSATLEWNLAPSFNEASFRFDPPAGAQKVVFAEAKLADGTKK
jgi:hypothetical protein